MGPPWTAVRETVAIPRGIPSRGARPLPSGWPGPSWGGSGPAGTLRSSAAPPGAAPTAGRVEGGCPWGPPSREALGVSGWGAPFLGGCAAPRALDREGASPVLSAAFTSPLRRTSRSQDFMAKGCSTPTRDTTRLGGGRCHSSSRRSKSTEGATLLSTFTNCRACGRSLRPRGRAAEHSHGRWAWARGSQLEHRRPRAFWGRARAGPPLTSPVTWAVPTAHGASLPPCETEGWTKEGPGRWGRRALPAWGH